MAGIGIHLFFFCTLFAIAITATFYSAYEKIGRLVNETMKERFLH
jgi:hypothetical protein